MIDEIGIIKCSKQETRKTSVQDWACCGACQLIPLLGLRSDEAIHKYGINSTLAHSRSYCGHEFALPQVNMHIRRSRQLKSLETFHRDEVGSDFGVRFRDTEMGGERSKYEPQNLVGIVYSHVGRSGCAGGRAFTKQAKVER